MRGMNNVQANLCLLAVTLCWSCEVVIFSTVPDGVNPFATTCITSLIGAALMIFCFGNSIAAAFQRDRWLLARRMVILSAMNTTYNVLNLVGLDYFDVSTGAFTLSMTVVILPVMLLVMRRGVSARTWISAACVLVGIFVAVSSTISAPQVMGLLVMLVSCIIRALFIVKLNDYARQHSPITLAASMSALNAVFAFIPWFIMQPDTFSALPWSTSLIATYVIYAYFIVCFATILNFFAQRRASAAQSTIVYSTEIVFSTIWATCLPGDIVDPVTLTLPIIIGCALIVAGNLVEIVPVGASEEASTKEEAEALAPDEEEDVAGFIPGLLSYLETPAARKVATCVIMLFVYLAISLPFKVLSVIPGFTDIRPVGMLQPLYGIFFGIPGCLTYAVGNLIGDITSDSLRWSSIAGFIANFGSPYLMYLFFRKLRKEPFNLRRGRTIVLYAVVAVICACLTALVITPAVAYYYPDVDIKLFATTVIANGTLFPIGFSIPLIILLQEEFGLEPVD